MSLSIPPIWSIGLGKVSLDVLNMREQCVRLDHLVTWSANHINVTLTEYITEDT